MKKFIITSILVALFSTSMTVKAQDYQEEYLGLPGDNLNLYAVMKLFQESKTLEDFERNLNDQNSNINNLDLNNDNLVDYIRVMDNIDGDVHNIVLQIAVSKRENQDVAVFNVMRFNNGQVQIQLTGDEELYGRNYIVEPIFDDGGETPNPGYTGNDQNLTYVRTTTVEIAAWPVVRYIYLPSYRGWHSSWYWDYYPSYWNPWRPYYWHYYYGYHYHWYNDYYRHYRRWDHHRYSRWDDYYYHGKRSYSRDVNRRIQAGTYRATYSQPAQRKNGEARFAQVNPNQNRRSSENSIRDYSTTTRRSTPAVNSTSTNRSNDRNIGTTTRRSSKSVNNRSVTNPSSTTKRSTTRRSNTSVTNKSVNNPRTDNNAVTTRKSSTTVTNKSVSNPSSGQNARSNRAATQSKSTGVSSSGRRDVKKSKSATVKKESKATKKSEKKESSSRR